MVYSFIFNQKQPLIFTPFLFCLICNLPIPLPPPKHPSACHPPISNLPCFTPPKKNNQHTSFATPMSHPLRLGPNCVTKVRFVREKFLPFRDVGRRLRRWSFPLQSSRRVNWNAWSISIRRSTRWVGPMRVEGGCWF